MAGEPVNLFAQQEANRRRSRLIVAAFVLFFAWLGFGGDWIFWQFTRDAEAGYRHVFPWLGIAMTGIAVLFTLWATKSGASRVLWSAGAVELTSASTPAEGQLVNVVEEMAIAAGLPKPRVHVIPDDDPNALATGLEPGTSHIAVTRGLLAICTRDELQAVVGHEMAHIRNFDTRLMTLLAGLVGAVALVADGLGRMMRAGVRVGAGRGGKRSKGGNPLLIVVLVLWVLSWLLAPLIVRLLALAVSRQREYLADATSAQLTRNPAALASALQKIERAHAPTSSIKKGVAHLCIADPLGRQVTSKEGKLADMLATHPPMAIRVARLKAMAYSEGGGRRTEGEPAPLRPPPSALRPR